MSDQTGSLPVMGGRQACSVQGSLWEGNDLRSMKALLNRMISGNKQKVGPSRPIYGKTYISAAKQLFLKLV